MYRYTDNDVFSFYFLGNSGNEIPVSHWGELQNDFFSQLSILMELQEKHKLALSQIAYVGDDLIDLPVMLQVGLSFAVANAVLEVKDQANYVTKNYGGNGGFHEYDF